MARIEMTLEDQLMNSMGPDGKTVDVERLIENAKKAPGDSKFKGSVKLLRPVRYFVNETERLPNGYYRMMCKIRGENGVRTYYAVFPDRAA